MHAGTNTGVKALKAINAVLDSHEAEREFDITLTARIKMKANCPDLRLQVAQEFMAYIRDTLHLDPNFVAEVISFKEIL